MFLKACSATQTESNPNSSGKFRTLQYVFVDINVSPSNRVGGFFDLRRIALQLRTLAKEKSSEFHAIPSFFDFAVDLSHINHRVVLDVGKPTEQ
ncbi:MAG: hypothetical protein Ct9H300mP11_14490 [Chloroflexota bacterium]|nr:MAG: hypothetical protein Ct9H300mP11_14490 [Chloroflexota bacterium]